MPTTRGRLVQVNQLVLDQADFFMTDGFTRVQGIVFSDVLGEVYFNNQQQPWDVVSGLNITDARAVSGKIFFNEVPGSPGIYSVKFRPNAVGYWRLLITYPHGTQTLAQDYDVTPNTPTIPPGVSSSFVRPSR